MSVVRVTPIRSEEDFDSAVARIEELWGAPAGSKEGDELDVLMDLVESYEQKHRSRVPLHPLKVIQSRMEDLRLKAKEVAGRVGLQPENFSAIIRGKRPLTLKTILPLADALSISPQLLIGPTPKEAIEYLKETMASAGIGNEDQRFILARLNDGGKFGASGNHLVFEGQNLSTGSEVCTGIVLSAIEVAAYAFSFRAGAALRGRPSHHGSWGLAG